MARHKFAPLDTRNWEAELEADFDSVERFEKMRHLKHRKPEPGLDEAAKVRRQFHRSRWG